MEEAWNGEGDARAEEVHKGANEAVDGAHVDAREAAACCRSPFGQDYCSRSTPYLGREVVEVDDRDIHTLGKEEDAGVLEAHSELHRMQDIQVVECSFAGSHRFAAVVKAWFPWTASIVLVGAQLPLVSAQT